MNSRQKKAKPSVAKQPCKPFETPIARPQGRAASTTKTVINSPYSTGLKPEAMDKLPPLDEKWILRSYRPEQKMSDAALELFRLKRWLEICRNDSWLHSEVYVTECRIREQAAFIIGYFV